MKNTFIIFFNITKKFMWIDFINIFVIYFIKKIKDFTTSFIKEIKIYIEI